MILLYHQLIKDKDVDENLYRRSYEGAPLLYFRKESLFEEDMSRIVENITLYDLPRKGVCITFDDCYSNLYEIAFPILKRYGLKASLFAPTKLIGTRGFMNWDQLREMARFGNTIESHTHNHVPLEGLSEEEVEYELNTSADEIKKYIGKRPGFVSLPAGRRFDPEIAEKCGYRGIRTSERGLGTNPWDLEVVVMLNNSEINVR